MERQLPINKYQRSPFSQNLRSPKIEPRPPQPRILFRVGLLSNCTRFRWRVDDLNPSFEIKRYQSTLTIYVDYFSIKSLEHDVTSYLNPSFQISGSYFFPRHQWIFLQLEKSRNHATLACNQNGSGRLSRASRLQEIQFVSDPFRYFTR